ncbi:MAG TPA: biotin--[acetyl-CoA-carboxylase] ligase [Bryobacteraceae bacterium]|jgi:BirA family biotin operon repressor/biotin-[acetyl-CoA-carboxylase] ligase|nr:biotin--[acetyl-CoA-carboxylase] ligase [Bryobacteraceae bacterium]
MPLDLDYVREHLPGRDLRYFDTLDTTMRAAAGCPPGTAVIAGEQTAGQGRHGHSWHSEKGAGLYVSIVLPTQTAPALTMALGLATAEAITAESGVVCDLRWPNDVMIGLRKAAGILAQLADSTAIAGIGVNVNHQRFPPELADEATSLRIASGRVQSRERLLIALLPAVDRYIEVLTLKGTAAILDLFSRRSTYASGKRIAVQQGDTILHGTTAGLTDAGFLVVRKDDGSDEIIVAGGVRAVGAGRG